MAKTTLEPGNLTSEPRSSTIHPFNWRAGSSVLMVGSVCTKYTEGQVYSLPSLLYTAKDHSGLAKIHVLGGNGPREIWARAQWWLNPSGSCG